MRKALIILVTALMLNGQWSMLNAQKKDGHWVDPVEYFKLKGKGNLKGDALYSYMWETKERYIVGMKCTVCAFTTRGDEYAGTEDKKLPYTPSTVYLYMDAPGAIATTSDWRKLPNGNMLGVYKIGGTDIRFSFNENTHQYSFDYSPEGSFDCDYVPDNANARGAGLTFVEHTKNTGSTDIDAHLWPGLLHAFPVGGLQ